MVNFKDNNEFEEFSGNAFFSGKNLTFVGFVILMVCIAFAVKPEAGSEFNNLFLIAPVIGFFFLFGYQMNYFLVSGSKIIIKNHYWWWRNIEYDLKDIQGVYIEERYKESKSLHINFKESNSRSFPAGSLRFENWQGLMQKFSSLGIATEKEF